MTVRRFVAVMAALVLGACGGGYTPDEPDPVPASTELGYSIPAANPVTYESSDTAHINIMVQPGQPMEQVMGQNSTVRLMFGPAVGTAGNLSVTANYVAFEAFIESAMMPRQTIGDEGLAGDFVLSLTPQGEVDLVSGPELPEEVEQMSMNNNLFADFFVRLPARMVARGESWSDTVTFSAQKEGASTTSETIVHSTFRGDTAVNGRTLWIIQSSKTTNVLVEGDMQGMSMRNELSGTISEVTLWDPVRRIMYSSSSRGQMTGVVSIPDAGMNDIPLDVNNVRSVRLVESGS